MKDVLQSLVDDNLVYSDKCGNQTVYWALPSAATQARRGKLEAQRGALDAKRAARGAIQSSIAKLRRGREAGAERDTQLARLSTASARVAELDRALQRFASLSPAAIKQMREDTAALRTGANRWTDNIFALQSWAVNKHGLDKGQFNKQFEISDELDYLDETPSAA